MKAEGPFALVLEAGGTKTGRALVWGQPNNPQFLAQDEVPTWAGHNSLSDVARTFTDQHQQYPISAICVSYAGPVRKRRSRGRNMPWPVTEDELTGAYSLQPERVGLRNDSVATGRGVLLLPQDRFTVLRPGEAEPGEDQAGSTKGTGDGRFVLSWNPYRNGFTPRANEGSHPEFGARTGDDEDLARFGRTRKQRYLSWEDLTAGPAIHFLYLFLTEHRGFRQSAQVTAELTSAADPSAVIASHFDDDPTCSEAMKRFVYYCGRAAGNDVLSHNAWGGYFLCGGVVAKNLSRFLLPSFAEGFLDKEEDDRRQLESVPVWGIADPQLALRGAAALALELID